MEIKLKLEGMDQLKKILDPKTFNKALAKAINNSTKKGFNEGVRLITQKYNITKRDIKNESEIKLASWKDQVAVIKVESSTRTSFKRFKPRQTKKGVSLLIKKNGERTLLKGAFIGGYIYRRKKGRKPYKRGKNKGKYPYEMVWVGANLMGGHVFMRKGDKRLPIQKQTADISIAELFGSRFVYPEVEKKVNEEISKEFKHQWDYYRGKK